MTRRAGGPSLEGRPGCTTGAGPDSYTTVSRAIKNYGKAGVKADESIIDYEEFEAKKHDVAANAILDACTGSNPRQPSQEEMEQLLECVYNDTPVEF